MPRRNAATTIGTRVAAAVGNATMRMLAAAGHTSRGNGQLLLPAATLDA
jgi:hypothetical protein